MRKIIPTLLILLLCMSLWGCGTAETSVEETTVAPVESQSATASTEATELAERMETYCDEKGNTIVVNISPDGSRTETCNYSDGRMVSIYNNPATGEYSEMEFSKDMVLICSKGYNPEQDRYSEVEYYENGKEKQSSAREPSTGFTSEQEYYENGNRKYIKTCDPKMEREIQYNEDGYCTYSKCINYRDDGSAYYEIECFGDEAGNLVKVIENGEEITDKKFLSDRVGEYHFRQ